MVHFLLGCSRVLYTIRHISVDPFPSIFLVASSCHVSSWPEGPLVSAVPFQVVVLIVLLRAVICKMQTDNKNIY